MGKSDKYVVIDERDKLRLERDVVMAIQQGWELVGGVSTSTDRDGRMIYAQAMIYREPIVHMAGFGPPPTQEQIALFKEVGELLQDGRSPLGNEWNVEHHAIGWVVVDKKRELFLNADAIVSIMHTTFATKDQAEAALQKWREKNKE